MSMQHSLEVRWPLLDRRVIELAFRLPQIPQACGATGKHLLKQVAARRLPAALLHAPKHGFTAPIGAWLAGPLARQFEIEVLGPEAHVRGMVDLQYVRNAFDAHRTGRADNWYLSVGCLGARALGCATAPPCPRRPARLRADTL